MEQNFIQQQKKQRNMLLVFLAVLLITVFVFWYGFFRVAPVEVEAPTFVENKIEIDLTVFNNPVLKAMTPFLSISPLEAGTSTQLEIGRENPFVPFNQ